MLGAPKKCAEDNYARYVRECDDVPGFFSRAAQLAWDFLLTAQSDMKIGGDFVEIGVYRGKSALLGAMYFKAPEVAILIDVSDVSATVERVASMGGPPTKAFVGRSNQFRHCETFRAHAGNVRFFHIDGDHSGFSTLNDLNVAADMISNRGIICVDDFENMRYPQLMAAVYRFLFARIDFKMFLIGGTKAYICQTESYPLWESMVRKYLAGSLCSHGVSATISKTSYALISAAFMSVHEKTIAT